MEVVAIMTTEVVEIKASPQVVHIMPSEEEVAVVVVDRRTVEVVAVS
jgi:hypothetical protein